MDRGTKKPLLFAKYGQILDLRGDWRLESSEFGFFMPNVVNSKDQIVDFLNDWVKHELIIDGCGIQARRMVLPSSVISIKTFPHLPKILARTPAT